MRALLVILSALGSAFLVMGYVRNWQMRKAIKTGKPVEAISNNYILGALVGFVVFALGVWWLESDSAPLLANKFWPGPLTVVAPIKDKTNLSKLITAGLDTVAIRVPAHPVARKLLETFNGPIAAPSANPSGSISSTSAAHVKSGLGGRIQAILNGGKCDVGLESTIILSNNGQCNILRSGGISEKEIEEVLGYKISQNQNPDTPISPGQLSSHYAPNANLRMNVIKADEDEYMIGFGDVVGQLNLSSQGNLIEAATNLFAYLHMADEDAITLGKTKIAIAKIPMHGLGIAINDRLTRASTPKS